MLAISNKNLGVVLGCILCIFALVSCKASLLKYKIHDNYVGPVVVFIYSNLRGSGSNNLVVINRDGLGIVERRQLNSKFIFISGKMETKMRIIDIGLEKEADEKKRGIYSLVKGNSSTKCSPHSLSMVLFFVGRKSDFENWSKMHKGELKYLEEKGIDWCSFYKKHLN